MGRESGAQSFVGAYQGNWLLQNIHHGCQLQSRGVIEAAGVRSSHLNGRRGWRWGGTKSPAQEGEVEVEGVQVEVSCPTLVERCSHVVPLLAVLLQLVVPVLPSSARITLPENIRGLKT